MTGGKKLGIGILGAAAIARKNVQAIAKTTNGAEVIAVGSRTLSKAEAFLKDVGLEGKAKAYGSYEEVLGLPDVQAVYLPLPTATHLEWVEKAAAAKKHILLEKPIALTDEETDAIVEACEQAGVQFMDGTMFVHSPRYDRIRAILDDSQSLGPLRSVTVTFYFSAAMRDIIQEAQTFGKPMTVTSTFTWKADEHFMANDVRTRKDGDALGCYGDIGWYCIRAALWAFNYEQPKLVQAHPGPSVNSNGVVMHGGGSIIWADGRRLTFDCGFDTVHSMYLQISGSDGMVEIDDFCIPYDPTECSFVQKGGATWHDHDTWIEQKRDRQKIRLDRPQETYMWEHFAENVYNIQAGGRPDASWAKQSALCNKLCIAIERSAQNGSQPVDVSNRL